MHALVALLIPQFVDALFVRGSITTIPCFVVVDARRKGERGRSATQAHLGAYAGLTPRAMKPINCNPRDPLAKSGLPEVMPYEALRQRGLRSVKPSKKRATMRFAIRSILIVVSLYRVPVENSISVE